jgi:Prokaryotic E2 family D/PIN domain
MISLRLVIDTNIVVSSALKPDSLPRTVILLALSKSVRWYVSDAILDEYALVLARPPILAEVAKMEEVSSDSNRKLGSISGRRFPHPALLFVVHGGSVYLRALSCTSRRSADTYLYAAPYWNTANDGAVCAGTMRVLKAQASQPYLRGSRRSFRVSSRTRAAPDGSRK